MVSAEGVPSWGTRAAKAPLRKGVAPPRARCSPGQWPRKKDLRQCRQQGRLFTCDSEVPVPSKWPWARAGHIGRYLVKESELRCDQAALQHQTVGGTGLRSPRRPDEGCRTGGLSQAHPPRSDGRLSITYSKTRSSAEPHGERKPGGVNIARSVCLTREGCQHYQPCVCVSAPSCKSDRTIRPHALHWDRKKE